MVNMEAIVRMNNCDVDGLIEVLALNEDRHYAWPVLNSPTVVREELHRS
jgi:hypothetical protein